MQKLRHQVLEAEVVREEAIQKLLLPYSWFKQYFPELKEKEAAVVRNPFSTALDVSDILDELPDQFYDLQNDSFARDVFQEMALSFSSGLLCANPFHKYPNWIFEYFYLITKQNFYLITLFEYFLHHCSQVTFC